MSDEPPRPSEADQAYADRLVARSQVWWKRLAGVQAPYRWNLRRLEPGRTLDVGCGTGRNLEHLDGAGVGVDPNAAGVAVARGHGLVAYTPEQFLASDDAVPASFDSLLFAHVLEHVGAPDATGLVTRYLPYLRPGGQVILITPQESGYRSDPTHVEFLDFAALTRLAGDCGLSPVRWYSFPFPRALGRVFRYNEFVVVATAP